MAKLIYKNSFFSINAVDISDHVREFSTSVARPEIDATCMGDSYVVTLFGIPDVTWTVTFAQDFAAGETDATLNGLGLTDTPFAVAWRPVNAAISATNPEYQMTALMAGYNPAQGGIGDLAVVEITLRNAASTGMVRDVTP
jgi:hypothetical protein